MIQKTIRILLVAAFALLNIIPPGHAQTAIPMPGTMITSGRAYVPVTIKGIEAYPDDPMMFDFIVDTGDTSLNTEALNDETAKLVRYFLAALTVPEEDMWVNLSPYEENRIIPESFGQTEMGHDLLAQDYILKQLSASLMYPEDDLGREFWKRVYEKAEERYGHVDIPMNTFNKIWILPAEASVYEYDKGAFIVDSRLKVMLEEDYLALDMNANSTRHGLGNVTRDDLDAVSGITAEVVREILIPEIEWEVNEGEHFANLRQIYSAMVLATWYKKRLEETLLGKVYVDQNKTGGIDLAGEDANRRIFAQYVEAYKKGVYEYIKEDYDAATQKVVEKKYFSGGVTVEGLSSDFAMLGADSVDRVRSAAIPRGEALRVTAGVSGVYTNGDAAMLPVLPRTNPARTPSWSILSSLAQNQGDRYNLRRLFQADPLRARDLTVSLADGFDVDFSKNLIDAETLSALLGLADDVELKRSIDMMFTGEKINETEGRAVLHTALRNVTRDASGNIIAANGPVLVDGEDVMPDVIAVLNKMKNFSERVRSGEWRGATGKRIKHVVNVGIGGSDLGPRMVSEALKSFKGEAGITPHFLSNIDPTAAAEIISELDPEETLVIIESKTFTTQETIQNAITLKDWVMKYYENAGDVDVEDAIKKHFVAVSTAEDLVDAFGIDTENMFEFWDWVGGRYSVWSAIGLPVAVTVGFDNFFEMLEGGREADEHFRTRPFERNVPVLKALMEVWYRNFFNAGTSAILPYDQYLGLFPDFSQQFFMESNGKSVDRNGRVITDYHTASAKLGKAGTDGQHSFYQQLHQGTQMIPADFIGVGRTQNPLPGHYEKFYSNFVAQPYALAFGLTVDEVKAELDDGQIDAEELQWMAAQRAFPGNRPTTSINIAELTPRSLGQLIAMYEHQIMAEGVIYNIFSFDQWGVQLGKVVATKSVLEYLTGSKPVEDLDNVPFGNTIREYVERYQREQSAQADNAELSTPVGGIDLNSAGLDLKTSNRGGFEFTPPTPEMLKNMQSVSGFTPAVIQIQPIINLPLILGLSDDAQRPYSGNDYSYSFETRFEHEDIFADDRS